MSYHCSLVRLRFRNINCRQKNATDIFCRLVLYFFLRMDISGLWSCEWCISHMCCTLFGNIWVNSFFKAEACSGKGGALPHRLRFGWSYTRTPVKLYMPFTMWFQNYALFLVWSSKSRGAPGTEWENRCLEYNFQEFSAVIYTRYQLMQKIEGTSSIASLLMFCYVTLSYKDPSWVERHTKLKSSTHWTLLAEFTNRVPTAPGRYLYKKIGLLWPG